MTHARRSFHWSDAAVPFSWVPVPPGLNGIWLICVELESVQTGRGRRAEGIRVSGGTGQIEGEGEVLEPSGKTAASGTCCHLHINASYSLLVTHAHDAWAYCSVSWNVFCVCNDADCCINSKRHLPPPPTAREDRGSQNQKKIWKETQDPPSVSPPTLGSLRVQPQGPQPVRLPQLRRRALLPG